MMTEQEPGGRVVARHDELARGLAMERGMISRAMPLLVAARLVTVIRRGRFQLHPMMAAFNDPREQQRAVKALLRDMHLDVGDFEDEYEDEYERRFQLHLEEKGRKAEAKAKGNVTPITKPTRLKRVRRPGRPGDTRHPYSPAITCARQGADASRVGTILGVCPRNSSAVQRPHVRRVRALVASRTRTWTCEALRRVRPIMCRSGPLHASRGLAVRIPLYSHLH
jgi:hypothetical protein